MTFEHLLDARSRISSRRFHIHGGRAEQPVGDDAQIIGFHRHGVHSHILQHGREHDDAHALPERLHQVLGPWGQLLEVDDAVQHSLQTDQLLGQQMNGLLLHIHRAGDVGQYLQMAVPQFSNEPLDVLLLPDLGHELDERVGDALDGRYHHDLLLTVGRHDGAHLLHGRAVL